MKFEDVLIKNVRMHRCLYDTHSEHYNVKSILAEVWATIASNVGVPLKKCRCRWRSLRNRFICEAHKMQELGGDHLYTTDKWEYYDALRFLKPHINKRKRLFNNQEPSDEDEVTMSSTIERVKFEHVHDLSAAKRKYSSDSDIQDESDMLSENLHSHNKTKNQQKPTKVVVQCESPSPQLDFLPVDSLNNSDSAEEELRMSTPTEHVKQSKVVKSCCGDYKNIETTLNAISEILNGKISKTEEENPNTGFLTMLDSYLKQLPEDIRESIKMKILNSVFNKIRELKNIRKHK